MYCSECGKDIELKVYRYSKDKFGKILCIDCQKELLNKKSKHNNYHDYCSEILVKEEPSRFPSHTLLYKVIHKIEYDILQEILKKLHWKTEYTFITKLEKKCWDITFYLKYTPEFLKNKKYLSKFKITKTLFVEYKSSIHEWDKQIDDYFRQINKKNVQSYNYKRILLTFDKRFLEWEEAFKRAEITLVVLPEKMMKVVMKGTY